MIHTTKTLAPETRSTLWRTLQTFSITRAIIGAVFLVYLAFNAPKTGFDGPGQLVAWETCAVYLALAIWFALLTAFFQKRFVLQVLTQVGVDIAAVSMLYVAAGGAKSGLAILYLFPLAGAAILAPLVLALFFVSLVTLVLLMESGYQLLNAVADASTMRAGLYCASFFAAVIVINRLAAKLIKQEDLAVRRGRDLQIQESINRLVIAAMGDGILVIGFDTTVFAGNPAAERMLGLSVPYGREACKLTDFPSLAPIADAFFNWAAVAADQAAGDSGSSTYVVVKPGDDVSMLHGTTLTRDGRRELGVRLKLRFKTVETAGLSEDRAVIFMQDVSEIENQAQQLKLASMGRLTASIAHEVRNPLAAISHAAALLSEDIVDTSQLRLLRIVEDNVKRLNRMIEDILKLSRKAQSTEKPLALVPFLSQVLDEFQETHQVAPDMISLRGMRQHQVRFDPLHLREVVVNLLSNALRYASGRSGSIRLDLVPDTANRLELHVKDDGPAITPKVRAHLFEPFFTTSSKGTGLGLYLARELCMNNNAMLDYEYRLDAFSEVPGEPSGRFVITFAVPDSI